MRVPALAFLLALGPAAFALAAHDPQPVTLQVTLGNHLLPPRVECAVALDVPATAAEVLDAAVATGCLESWEAEETPGLGRYVTCIDDTCAPLGTYWAFYLNEAQAQGGVDNTNGKAAAGAGDVVEFVLSDWFTPCAETASFCGFLP